MPTRREDKGAQAQDCRVSGCIHMKRKKKDYGSVLMHCTKGSAVARAGLNGLVKIESQAISEM
jgi:hypothetical protein